MQNLFDTALFLSEKETWLQPVFKKKFDAYFFLKYPHAVYCGEPEAFNPFGLMSNLREQTIFVSNIKGEILLEWENKNWQLADYYEKTATQCGKERFLFWHSEKEQWAMVSDLEKGFSVIGVDWKIANQIDMHFQNMIILPNEVLGKLNLGEKENIFLQHYAPADVLTKGNAENPIWVKYYFQCHVENENDKLFYWKSFEPLQEAMTTVLSDFQSIDMYADQGIWRRYKQKGQIYASGKNAAVGGWQKYSHKNCEKVATKFLTQNQHLELKFEGKIEESEALYMANKDGLIEFMAFWVYANIEKTKVKGQSSDFHFSTGMYSFGDKIAKYNQNFEFSYKKDLINDEKITVFLAELTTIGFVLKIHRLEQPYIFARYEREDFLKIEGMYSVVPKLDV